MVCKELEQKNLGTTNRNKSSMEQCRIPGQGPNRYYYDTETFCCARNQYAFKINGVISKQQANRLKDPLLTKVEHQKANKQKEKIKQKL